MSRCPLYRPSIFPAPGDIGYCIDTNETCASSGVGERCTLKGYTPEKQAQIYERLKEGYGLLDMFHRLEQLEELEPVIEL